MNDGRLVNLIAAYRKCKAALEKIEQEKIKPIKQKMEEIETEVLKILDEQGASRVKTPAGVAQKRVMHSFKLDEPDVFLSYVIKNQAWHLLDLRCNRTAAKQMLEEDENLPPGVSHRAYVKVTFPAK